MNPKTVVVHCTYSDDEKDISEFVVESFRIFLQKELSTFAATCHNSVS